ncbi:tRNA lysidine(34) synthetase TilS [Oceanospirillaceae bacterium ASx5O]|nr:tRNA lysidine(34) synthetase TilS [Oceanospirillaceae bacterium ASx5O]
MSAPFTPECLLPLLQPLLNQGGRLLVGFSGGLDSTVLLHSLARLAGIKERLRALHIHHGLSLNADHWAQHCASQCAQLQIPLQTLRVQVTPSGNGIEEAARQARYAAFCAHSQPGDLLLLAQHADDQTETFFMRLLRGAGLDGLAGMPAQRQLQPGVTLFRPLLGYSHAQLQAWAVAEKLAWIEDESNADNRYDRNWWRNHLLPQLWQRFPGRQAALARSLQQLQQDQQVLQALLEPHLQACLQPWPWPQCAALALDGEQLLQQPALLQPYILRGWLRRCGVTAPSAQWLQQVFTEVLTARPDRQPVLALGEWRLYRHRHSLYLHRPVALPALQTLNWPPAVALPWAGAPVSAVANPLGLLPGCYQLVPAAASPATTLRAHDRPEKSLAVWLQQAGVPVPLRPHWPVWVQDDQLAAISGIAVAETFCVSGGLRPDWSASLI